MTNEPSIKRGRLPRGYSLVLKGNVYITANCRKQTQAANQTVYLVVNTKEKQIGIAVPADIYENVKEKEAETRTARAANVNRRDNAIKNEFEQVVLEEFPRLPLEDLPKILEKALQKRAGKVGRTGQLSDRRKALLAVRAHIRHCHTQYDSILRARDRKRSKDAKSHARQSVQSQVDEIAAAWARQRGRSSQPPRSPAKASALTPSSASAETFSKSRKVPATVKARLVRMKQSATLLPTAPATDLPSRPYTTLLSSPQPLEIQKQVPLEVIDLTMDSDDDDDGGDGDGDDDNATKPLVSLKPRASCSK